MLVFEPMDSRLCATTGKNLAVFLPVSCASVVRVMLGRLVDLGTRRKPCRSSRLVLVAEIISGWLRKAVDRAK